MTEQTLKRSADQDQQQPPQKKRCMEEDKRLQVYLQPLQLCITDQKHRSNVLNPLWVELGLPAEEVLQYSPTACEAHQSYQTYEGCLMNKWAREQSVPKEWAKRFDALRRCFLSRRCARLRWELVVFRGLDGAFAAALRKVAMGTRVLCGAGFFSTSLDFCTAHKFAGGSDSKDGVVLAIRVPEETRYLAGSKSEAELIFPANGMIQLVGTRVQKDGDWSCYVICCNFIPD